MLEHSGEVSLRFLSGDDAQGGRAYVATKMWCTGCLNRLCVAVMFGGWTLQHPDFQGQRSLGPFFRLAQARLTSEVGGKWCLVVCIMKLLVVYN